MVYLAIIITIAADYFLYKTRTGLNLRAIGENPATADAAGIDVARYKYLATCTGCAISGLGGIFYVMCYIKGTWENSGTIEALGWLAVALVIFTMWRPINAIWGSYLFGACFWLNIYMPSSISQYISTILRVKQITHLQNIYKCYRMSSL